MWLSCSTNTLRLLDPLHNVVHIFRLNQYVVKVNIKRLRYARNSDTGSIRFRFDLVYVPCLASDRLPDFAKQGFRFETSYSPAFARGYHDDAAPCCFPNWRSPSQLVCNIENPCIYGTYD